MKKLCITATIILVVFTVATPLVKAEEIDVVVTVSGVIDGDTFKVEYELGRFHKYRLADIDAPEYGEGGYITAKEILNVLINKKQVFLDIDDIYRKDKYGRYVCVVYIKTNSTHYLNVNKHLLDRGVAVISNYPNEFNPYSWTLYVHKDVIPEFSSFLPLLFMMITLLTVLLSKVKAGSKR